MMPIVQFGRYFFKSLMLYGIAEVVDVYVAKL